MKPAEAFSLQMRRAFALLEQSGTNKKDGELCLDCMLMKHVL